MMIERSPRMRWFGLVAVSLGVAMIIVDATIVNVAVPSIIRDIGATASDAQWIQETYTLVFAALLLVAGRTADRHGRRKVFLVGVVLFVAASLLCAVVGSPPALIGGRALQGVGGAMILPTSLSLINTTFTGRERGIAFAVWGSTIGGMAALGPLLGGWLTTDFSWRWAFGVNVPVGAVVVAGVALLVAESRQAQRREGNDWLGTVLSALGFAAIVFGLVEGRSYGWFTRTGTVDVAGLHWTAAISPIPIAFVLGVVALAVFVWWELRRNRLGKAVLLDLQLFAIASFRNGNAVAAIVSLGEFGLLFSLPLWLQNALGYSAFRTGIALLPLAAGSFLASGFVPIVAKSKGPLFAVRLGIALEILGLLGIALVAAPHTKWWAISLPLLAYGIGVGFATAQVTGVVLADVPPEVSGQASGTQSTARQLGSALGIAVLGTVLFSTLSAKLTAALPDTPARSRLVGAVKDSAGAAIAGLPGPEAEAARRALSEATSLTAYVASGFLLLGLIATLRLSKFSSKS